MLVYKYEGFDGLAKWMEPLLHDIHKYIGFTSYKRVGIRYIDKISPIDDLRVEDLVHEHFKPFLPNINGAKLKANQSIDSYQTCSDLFGNGSLLLKAYNLEDEYPVPPDLWSVTKEFGMLANEPNKFLILDTDHSVSYQNAKIYKNDEMLELIDWLHTYTSRLFKDAVTKEALKAWATLS